MTGTIQLATRWTATVGARCTIGFVQEEAPKIEAASADTAAWIETRQGQPFPRNRNRGLRFRGSTLPVLGEAGAIWPAGSRLMLGGDGDSGG